MIVTLVTTTTEIGTLETTRPFAAQINPLGIGFGSGGETTDVQAHLILGTTLLSSNQVARRGVLNWQIGATARFGDTTHFLIDVGLHSNEDWDNLLWTGPELSLSSFRGGVGLGTSW